MAQKIPPKTYRCPACNMPQPRDFEECPQCGVIVAKYKRKLEAELEPRLKSADSAEEGIIWVDDVHGPFPGPIIQPKPEQIGGSPAQGPKPEELDVAEVVKDIRAKMIDAELMEKYTLSATELRKLIEKLVDDKVIDYSEVCRLPIFREEEIQCEHKRHAPRSLLAFTVRVNDAHDPKSKGWVVDISTEGLGVCGMDMEVGEIKSLVMIAKRPGASTQIVFDAECRWTGRQESQGNPVAGLQIRYISPENMKALQDFIRFITLGG